MSTVRLNSGPTDGPSISSQASGPKPSQTRLLAGRAGPFGSHAPAACFAWLPEVLLRARLRLRKRLASQRAPPHTSSPSKVASTHGRMQGASRTGKNVKPVPRRPDHRSVGRSCDAYIRSIANRTLTHCKRHVRCGRRRYVTRSPTTAQFQQRVPRARSGAVRGAIDYLTELR